MKQRVELSSDDIASIIRDALRLPEATIRCLVDVVEGQLNDIVFVVDGEIVPEPKPTEAPAKASALVLEMPPK